MGVAKTVVARTGARRLSRGDRVLDGVNIVLIAIFLLIVLYPLYYLLVASFSTVSQIVNVPFLLYPLGLTLDNYATVFSNSIIWSGFFNSTVYLVVGVFINITMTVLAAYPLSRDDFSGRKWLLRLVVLTMYFSGGLIPNYLVVRDLGMLNSLGAMVLPNAVNAFMIIIAVAFFRNTVPKELQEAGLIDGCNNFRLLLRVVLPVSLPLIGVLALQYGLGHWNSYVQALVYLTDRDKFPLQLVLREILIRIDSEAMMTMVTQTDSYEETVSRKEGVKYVSMVVSSVPLLLLYPFLTRFFEKGMTLGAIKE